MIPYIRSLSELMAITESRDIQKSFSKENIYSHALNREQMKRFLRSNENNKEIVLPKFSKTIISKWKRKKESISRFIYELDYNNQIQTSYDLTLLNKQTETNQKDVA